MINVCSVAVGSSSGGNDRFDILGINLVLFEIKRKTRNQWDKTVVNNVKYPECLLCSFDPSTLTLSWTYVNVGSVAVRSGTCRKERDVHYFIRKDTVGVNSLFGHADPYQLEQQFWLRRQLRGQLRQRRQRLPFYLLLQAWWIVLFVRSVGSKDERLISDIFDTLLFWGEFAAKDWYGTKTAAGRVWPWITPQLSQKDILVKTFNRVKG